MNNEYKKTNDIDKITNLTNQQTTNDKQSTTQATSNNNNKRTTQYTTNKNDQRPQNKDQITKTIEQRTTHT